MPDHRFFESASGPISVVEAVRLAGADLVRGDATLILTHVAALHGSSDPAAIVYCENLKSAGLLTKPVFGLCFAAKDSEAIAGQALALTKTPRLAFALAAARLHRSIPFTSAQENPAGAHQSAVISVTAEIGDGAVIGPHAYIGPGVVIGEETVIGASASISHALIGPRTKILPGARIGQSGFGFAPGPHGLVKVPQLGRVVIGAGVEIGANAAIDRGALEDTIIGDGTKIDNLVQIGHNVRIGRNCIIAAQCGVSGSCVIGDGVMMGGQVGLADHLTIGDGAMIAAGSGLMRDVPAGEKWGGRPGRPIKDWLRETATLAKLAKKRNE